MERKERDYTVQSVDKALELLEVLSEFPSGTGLQPLAARLRLSRNKTFRILRTLCAKGLVEHDDSTGCYQVGLHSLSLAHKLLGNMNVVQYAHPILEDLARKHEEAAYMTVARDAEVFFVDMVDCDQPIKAAPLVGKRFPFFSNAAGKVMRAVDSRDLLEKLLKKIGNKSPRPNLDQLDSELREIRRKGVAIDKGGLGEGIISVAVAVRDYTGKVVGAITLIGPSFRMLGERLENEIIPSMVAGAELLSAKFGYAPPRMAF